MTQASLPLRSLEAWTAAAEPERDEAVAGVLRTLPGATRGPARAGQRGLATLRAGGREWILVPGGVFRRGISPLEVQRIEARLGLGEGMPGAAHYRPWLTAVLGAATPVEVVRVPPFLVSLRPVLARELEPVLRKRLAHAWQQSLAEHVPFDELWGRHAPALVPSAALADVIANLADGGRLLRDVEWEYLAREGGSASWVAEPLDTRENALGLRGFGAPAWVDGGTGARGGGWDAYPWQDSGEHLHLVAGARPSPEQDPNGRFVWRARSLELDVAAEGAPVPLDVERPPPPAPELDALLRDLASEDPVPWRRALGRLQKRAAGGDAGLGAIVPELLAVVGAEAVAGDPERRARIAAFATELAAAWSEGERGAVLPRCLPLLGRLERDGEPRVVEAARRMRNATS